MKLEILNMSIKAKDTPENYAHEDIRRFEKEYVLHSWCVQNQYDAPVVVGGKASSFWDMDGNTYLDFSSQAMCNSLGHQHPKVVEAIKHQADELCFVQGTWAVKSRALLAKKLSEVAPKNLSKTFFTTSGAESNENAIKFARMFTGKNKIITRYRSYHGASAGAISLSGDPRRWAAEPGIPGIVRQWTVIATVALLGWNTLLVIFVALNISLKSLCSRAQIILQHWKSSLSWAAMASWFLPTNICPDCARYAAKTAYC